MGKEKFDNIPSKVFDLLTDVKNGRIGLPDLQRPFVWKDAKIRDLLDSMLKGYPIGYIMLWTSPADYVNAAHIGKNDKIYTQPDDLVIDGQQRLTALLAAMLTDTKSEWAWSLIVWLVHRTPYLKTLKIWIMQISSPSVEY